MVRHFNRKKRGRETINQILQKPKPVQGMEKPQVINLL